MDDPSKPVLVGPLHGPSRDAALGIPADVLRGVDTGLDPDSLFLRTDVGVLQELPALQRPFPVRRGCPASAGITLPPPPYRRRGGYPGGDRDIVYLLTNCLSAAIFSGAKIRYLPLPGFLQHITVHQIGHGGIKDGGSVNHLCAVVSAAAGRGEKWQKTIRRCLNLLTYKQGPFQDCRCGRVSSVVATKL